MLTLHVPTPSDFNITACNATSYAYVLKHSVPDNKYKIVAYYPLLPYSQFRRHATTANNVGRSEREFNVPCNMLLCCWYAIDRVKMWMTVFRKQHHCSNAF